MAHFHNTNDPYLYGDDTNPNMTKPKFEQEKKAPKLNRIKAVLAEKGVSNKELADAVDVTIGTVSSWCRNVKQPRVEKLFEIAKVLEVEPATLLNSLAASGF